MKYVVHANRTPHDVFIGRGSQWGNPYSHLPNSTALYKVTTVEEAVDKYATYLLENEHLMKQLKHLRGKILGCPCGGIWPCHGHILAALANEDYDPNDYGSF